VPALEAHRRSVFVLALAVLIAGGVAMALGRGEPVADPQRDARAPRPLGAPERARRGPGGSGTRAGAAVATRFARAYLRYQVGALSEAEQERLLRSATPRFGRELLRAPVRVPPGSRPGRERVLGVSSIRASLFQGEVALLAGVLIAGPAGTHPLRVVLLRRTGRWLVTGIGP
jgi:hypothetical protein